jgi:hypothetical protein
MGFGSLEPGNQSITAKRNGNTGIQYTHEISGCPKLGSLKTHHSGCFFEYGMKEVMKEVLQLG